MYRHDVIRPSLENKNESGYIFILMKALLLPAFLVLLLNCPVVLLTLDESHSVAVVNEHGVEHLVFFHAADSDKHSADAMFRAEVNEENHEVHIQNAAGLLRNKLEVSSLVKNLGATSTSMLAQTSIALTAKAPVEPDVGSLHPPVNVLRI